ncbi:7969_t:CDS:2, partial [Gigaspora rosea]
LPISIKQKTRQIFIDETNSLDSSNVFKDASDSQLENAALFFTQNLDTRTPTRYSGVPEVESESSDTVKGNDSDSWTLSSPIPSNLSTYQLQNSQHMTQENLVEVLTIPTPRVDVCYPLSTVTFLKEISEAANIKIMIETFWSLR